jgi:hypothetical protein
MRRLEVAELLDREYVQRVAWQEPAALSVVALTALTWLWVAIRRRRRASRRPTGCECRCAAAGPHSPVASILLRAHKGQAPQMIVRLR